MAVRKCPNCEEQSDFDERKFTCCLARYSSGTAAKLLGISKNTIYLLEKKQKIAPVGRQKRNNYRIFTDEDLFRFRDFWEAVEEKTTS
jgi:DNA-binding XRE family transcriptional regulator